MTEQETSPQVFLTFAELEFLLGRLQSWPQIRAAFALPSSESPDETAAAGLASLAVRGLVRTTDDELVLNDMISGTKGLVESAKSWIRIAHASTGEFRFSGSVGVGDADVGHVVVTPVGLGCFEFVGVGSTDESEIALAEIAIAALSKTDRGVVAFGAGDQADVPDLSVSVANGEWSVFTPSSKRERLDRGAAVAAAKEDLRALIAKGVVR